MNGLIFVLFGIVVVATVGYSYGLFIGLFAGAGYVWAIGRIHDMNVREDNR